MDVTILIPTYNRKQFEKLIELNIITQKYPFIKEIIIADDGEDDALCITCKYPIRYLNVPRMTIGAKRNLLIKESTTEFNAFMDTDDFYSPNYISVSIYNLLKTGKKISGSANMLMMNSEEEIFIQQCSQLPSLNEATLVFRKDIKFADVNTGEGRESLPIMDIVETSIGDIMVCIAHTGNTVDKSVWLTPQNKVRFDMKVYADHLKLLSDAII